MAADFMPPMSVRSSSINVVSHPFFAAYFWYIERRSAANKAASSPPVPARNSMIRAWGRFSLFVARSSCNSCSAALSFSWRVLSSSSARESSSGWSSAPSISRFSCNWVLRSSASWDFFRIFSILAFFLESSWNLSQSEINAGFWSSCKTASYSCCSEVISIFPRNTTLLYYIV